MIQHISHWLVVVAAVTPGQAATELELRLLSGQRVVGLATDHDDTGVVLDVEGELMALDWKDIDTSSAYMAKKALLVAMRGTDRNFTAEDHYHLGYFLAARNRYGAAGREFRQAESRDPSMAPRIKQAWRDIRRAKESNNFRNRTKLRDIETPPPAQPVADRSNGYLNLDEAKTQEILKVYREFGEKVRREVAPDLVLLETRHFMVWTDWTESSRNLIPDWAEQMYSMLCREFGFSPNETIWLGKCPLFCFRNRARFEAFAQKFDNYAAGDALGYAKTDSTGYVHVVLRRLGSDQAAIDRFATTLVHEGTHGFMHCYRAPVKLPAWFEEGLADYVAERVVPDRSRTGENSVRLARQVVAQGRRIDDLFQFTSSPPGHYYPIAHSIVDYLIRRDRAAFVSVIDDTKSGMAFDHALARHYKGMDTRSLELAWRNEISRAMTAGKAGKK